MQDTKKKLKKKTAKLIAVVLAAGTVVTTGSVRYVLANDLSYLGGNTYTASEIERYEDSLTASDKFQNMFKSDQTRKSETKTALLDIRTKDDQAAEKQLTKFYKNGVLSAAASQKDIKAMNQTLKELSKDKDATQMREQLKQAEDIFAAETKAKTDVEAITSRDQYNAAKTEVDALVPIDKRQIVTDLVSTLKDKDAELTLKENEERARIAVSLVWKDNALVGDRDAYNAAMKAVGILPDGNAAKTELSDALNKANSALAAKEEAEKKAQEEAQRKAEEAKKAAQQKAAQQRASTKRSSSSAPQQQAPAKAASGVRYTWYASPGGQAQIDAGKFVSYYYPHYYAADIKTSYGKQIRSLRRGDIVSMNGRLIQIDGEVYGNYNTDYLQDTVGKIPGWTSGGTACFQTCIPPYGGPFVVKYGHFV